MIRMRRFAKPSRPRKRHAPTPPGDVQHTVDDAPRNDKGEPVDHRTGRPLDLTNASGDRGWVMRYDPETDSWVSENRGLSSDKMPPTGEPGSYGYDENGNLLPYANHRPDYAEEQVEDVWTLSRDEQIKAIYDGELDLPQPGPDQMWVQKLDDADGPDIHIDSEGNKWAKIEWKPGQSRDGLWDMGHRPGREYSKLKHEYLSGQISKEEFLKRYRTADNYRVQDPGRNRAHTDEQ